MLVYSHLNLDTDFWKGDKCILEKEGYWYALILAAQTVGHGMLEKNERVPKAH